jgi:hypothetical protein
LPDPIWQYCKSFSRNKHAFPDEEVTQYEICLKSGGNLEKLFVIVGHRTKVKQYVRILKGI